MAGRGIQLGVLGSIGLCGVLVTSDGPFWLEMLAGILAVVALLLACVATVLIGVVAWPLRPYADPARLVRQLRGVILASIRPVATCPS